MGFPSCQRRATFPSLLFLKAGTNLSSTKPALLKWTPILEREVKLFFPGSGAGLGAGVCEGSANGPAGTHCSSASPGVASPASLFLCKHTATARGSWDSILSDAQANS